MGKKTQKKSRKNSAKQRGKESVQAEPKKKRGRPKGSKNKSTLEKEKAAGKKGNKVEKQEHYSWEKYDTTQRGLLVIFLFGLAAISVLSFVNAAAEVGVWTDKILGMVFGWGRYASPILFASFGYIFLHPERYRNRIKIINYIGLVLFVLGLLGLFQLFVPLTEFKQSPVNGKGGGYIGLLSAYPLMNYGGIWVSIIVLLGATVAGWLIMFNTSLHALYDQIKRFGMMGGIGRWMRARMHAQVNGYDMTGADDEEDEDDYEDEVELEEPEVVITPEKAGFTKKEIAKRVAEVKKQGALEQAEFIPKQKPKRKHRKITIPLDLLTHLNEKAVGGNIEENKETIRKTFESFNIDVTMDEVSVGPKVSQYTFRPAEGVKLNQITTLQNDIALALAAHPIRLEAPIPGKSLVGIEVPNKSFATVSLYELLASKKFKKRKNDLMLAVGKDVAGKPYLSSIATMPHLLIAGATGSGKSVCMNVLILSLIYQNSPDDLKLIMVDPKRVELSIYNGIPHLLTPVITDPEKTLNALKWTVAEMDRRYDLLSKKGKRNIEEFNNSVETDEEKMPYIVFMIDELADLMAVAAKSVEAAIVRLAQMSRAVGIHLVLATQRPSVNVITGLIKANMPARIAFSVTSIVDSRTILDTSGAEKLLGKGDMLYMDSETSKPVRVQGAFVSTEEITKVVEYLKEHAGDPDYDTDVTEAAGAAQAGMGSGSGGASSDSDELLPQAKEVIIEAGKASASFLQRRLRVGYARAARILDILEDEGFIGPANGSKPREILGQIEEPEGAGEMVEDGGPNGNYSVNGEMPPVMEEEDDVPEEVRSVVDDVAAASRKAVEQNGFAEDVEEMEKDNEVKDDWV